MAAKKPTPGEPSSAAADDVGRALEQALVRRKEIGLVVLDADLRVRRAVIDAAHFPGLRVVTGERPVDLVPPGDAENLTARLEQVLRSGAPDLVHTQQLRGTPLVVSLLALRVEGARVEGARDRGDGLLVALIDVTDEHRARERLDLLFRTTEAIGESLDVLTTARRLADAFVPATADLATVNLAEEVFVGGDPPPRHDRNVGLRRAAMAAVRMECLPPYLQPGEAVPDFPDVPLRRQYRRGEVVSVADREAVLRALGGDTGLMARVVPPDAHHAIGLALIARGMVLGTLELWRVEGAPPFDDNDIRVLRAVASRGALSIDNARRYTRERLTALQLQQSLLPPLSHSTAARTAARYLPASSGGGVGGDWYDVVQLSSLRVALVVGDVVGHGLRATAMMGRMRTAVQTLADLDLAPDELLTHLDDLVLRLAEENELAALGSTCLFAVYDPVARRCALASAGHPPPGLIRPDGRVEFIELSPGPPLGVGGLPFEVTEIELEPGSVLVFYTDGLVAHPDRDIDAGMDALRASLRGAGPSDDLEALASLLVDEMSPERGAAPPHLADDATLLLARVREVPPSSTALWELPAEDSAVATARELAIERLTSWRAPEELSFVAELVVSELVTNAVRYGGGSAVRLRLIRDGDKLVCEVSDPSSTAPHLKRAKSEDEGGRGLFIVAQLGTRWGVRFSTEGKTIWTELPWKR